MKGRQGEVLVPHSFDNEGYADCVFSDGSEPGGLPAESRCQGESTGDGSTLIESSDGSSKSKRRPDRVLMLVSHEFGTRRSKPATPDG